MTTIRTGEQIECNSDTKVYQPERRVRDLDFLSSGWMSL
jgi:hypothetical protein